MTDLERILPLWHELDSAQEDYVLATVVAVEGSSYRKPGARMLLAQDGRRAGTVSGGCLEAEVARRAWWLTAEGPVVERYSTAADDGEMPYGSGCGGVVSILLERKSTAAPLLAAMETAFHARIPLAIATVLEGPRIGTRAFSPGETAGAAELQVLAARGLARRASFEQRVGFDAESQRVWVDYRSARPGLWIFGAGDDAKPLLAFARELGWFVAVADGRAHLATRSRFAEADTVNTLPIADLPGNAPGIVSPLPTDACVLMTHSFEQDARILASLLALSAPPAYIGVLGPQRRTHELLQECARLLGFPATDNRIDHWMDQFHAPTGLDLGAASPATIALSILAEIQKTLTAATGRPLREVRATREILASS
jgi:xanthine dehydrogenase accessory factor